MKQIAELYERNKRWLFTALIMVFVWGMFAHGYVFLNNNPSHDSLREFHSEILGNDIKMGSGRVFTPIYRELLGSDVTLPWFFGVLSLLWIGLAVFLVIRIFNIESKIITFLIAGIFTTNISVSATAATYIHDLDSYMFAMVCAVAAVYLWKGFTRGWLFGIVPIAVSLGIYQSYLFVAVTLIMIVCIMELLNYERFKDVLLHGLKGIIMIVLGGMFYYLSMKLILNAAGIPLSTGEYNSLDVMLSLSPDRIAELVLSAYQDWFERLFCAYSSYPSILVKGIFLSLCIIFVLAYMLALLNKKIHIAEKLLCTVLVLMLPLGMNMIHVLTNANNHDLMVYPIWLYYLFVLLLSDWLVKLSKSTEHKPVPQMMRIQHLLCIFLIFALLYGNVRFANGMYIKKDLEHDAYVSLMTRVLGRIENLDGYLPGETPVVFVGLPENLNEVLPGFKDYWNVTAMTNSDMIYASERSRFQAFFDYILGVPILLADGNVWTEITRQESVEQMPNYPADGCTAFQNGVLIVKLGNES